MHDVKRLLESTQLKIAVRIRTAIVSDKGASLVEYALLVALIAVVCIAALSYFQQETSKSLSESASAIDG